MKIAELSDQQVMLILILNFFDKGKHEILLAWAGLKTLNDISVMLFFLGTISVPRIGFKGTANSNPFP